MDIPISRQSNLSKGETRKDIRKVLAVGGSDPSGGAGIQADIKTLSELGVYPYTAITAVTVQNSTGVSNYEVLAEKLLRQQMEVVSADGEIHGIKTGMLGSPENVLEVSRFIGDKKIKYSVIDPVLSASDGNALTQESSVEHIKKNLLSVSFMVTPNVDEAYRLTGVAISHRDDLLGAAEALKKTGVAWVLIKGGHLKGDLALDILYDGKHAYYFEEKKIECDNVRGTGCMLASAICTYLVRGLEPFQAVGKAKAYVYNKIKNAVRLGEGSLQALHFTTEDGNHEDRID